MPICKPDLIKRRITDITVDELTAMHIKAMLLDVDNTLTTHDSQVLTDAVRHWLDTMKEAGFALMIVSNAREERVKPFADNIGLPFEFRAKKPLGCGFSRAVKRLNLSKKDCMVIGDQLFTDLLGAKWSGIRVAQVMPIELEYGKPFMMFKRRLERVLMKQKG